MHKGDQQSTSYWSASVPLTEHEPLLQDTLTDVCVVGAGIAGLTTAYLLAAAGKSVVVLNEGPIGCGQTRQTTAHLSNEIDDRYTEMERLHGAEGARLAAESHTAAISKIEQIASAEKISCDFQRLDGWLFPAEGDSVETLQQELEAAHRAGLRDVELCQHMPAPFSGPGLRFPRQGQFHPLAYLKGLADALARRGGRVFGGTHVQQVEGGEPAQVSTARGPIVRCSAVVVATNSPINDRFSLHTKQAPYMTYAIAAPLPRATLPPGLYWDTADPYHYVRVQPLHASTQTPELAALDPQRSQLLIVGGEDHKTGQADDQEERFGRLESWIRTRIPELGPVAFRWSGQVQETIDGLAFIGRNPMDKSNVYIATGDSGMGMTHGTIAGMLLSDLILGRDNPWATLYDPSRKTLRAGGEFLKENLNVARKYADWLTPGDVSSVEEIAPDSGAVIREGLHKVAVFRDAQRQLHRLSAVCTHLGCIVAWNANDRTWDCPCHGSRFDCHGKVIIGPANRGLVSLDEKAESSGNQ